MPSTASARQGIDAGRASGRVALVVPSVMASGTERRLAFVYKHLERRYPGEYLLVLPRDLCATLDRGGFGLSGMQGVRVLTRRWRLDLKRGAHASPLVNLNRIVTLLGYRREVERLIETDHVRLVHAYLEMVPVLGLMPLRQVPTVVAIVDHLPKYYDRRRIDCRLLLRAIDTSTRVDCLYAWISGQLEALGVDRRLLNYPAWNCVNHDAFHPEDKDELSVSFAARTIDWKNPLLMLDVIDYVLKARPDARFSVLGSGRLQSALAQRAARRGWQGIVRTGYLEDPSPIVNRSSIHVSLDRFDNSPDQSLLEGMAAGCAIVASQVGETGRVVTDDVGILAPLEAAQLGEAILRLLADPGLARRLGRAARARVMAHHHVDAYVEYLHDVHDLDQTGRVMNGVRVPVQAAGRAGPNLGTPAAPTPT